MARKKTHKEFVEEVRLMYGDEYKVLGRYVNSKTKIKILHTKCGNEYDVEPNSFLKGHGCSFCFGNNIKTQEQFKSEVFNIVGNEYVVLSEYINSHTDIQMLHKTCKHKFYINPSSFLHSNDRCPYCSKNNIRILIGINDMHTTNPFLSSLLKDQSLGYKYTEKSGKKVDWVCPQCGEIIKNKSIIKINERGLSCPRCSDGISYPNRLMYSVLNNLHIDFKTEKYFKWCKYHLNNKIIQGKYDFYFNYNDKEYVVEMDGAWHFKNNNISGQTKEESNQIDIEKDRLAIEHNIYPIRINCEKSELEYIKNEILKSDLKNIFDLSKIDWEECQIQSLSSLRLQACELWEKHHSTKIISEIMKKHQTTINRWLKSCAEVGLCNYIPVFKKSVICIETNAFFDSMNNASKEYNIHPHIIAWNCNNKNKNPCKYNWRYATPEEIQIHKEGENN